MLGIMLGFATGLFLALAWEIHLFRQDAKRHERNRQFLQYVLEPYRADIGSDAAALGKAAKKHEAAQNLAADASFQKFQSEGF